MKVYCAEAGGWLPRIYDWIKDDNMKVYCAERRPFDLIFNEKPPIPKFNILFSFYNSQSIEPYLPFMKELIVDSGAFSLQKQKVSEQKVRKYVNDYKKFIEQNTSYPFINGFFELDIPRQIGYDNVKEIRKELFEISNKIIPVWHKEYGIDEFKRMVNNYDYIGVSCVRNRSIKKQSYGKFVNYTHKHNCKIHGLGMLSKPKDYSKNIGDYPLAFLVDKMQTRGMETYGLSGGYTSLERFERLAYLKQQAEKQNKFDDIETAFHLCQSVEQIYGATPVNSLFEYTIYSAVYDTKDLSLYLRGYEDIIYKEIIPTSLKGYIDSDTIYRLPI